MKSIINTKEEKVFLDSLKDIVKSARRFAYNSINLAQLQQNWLIGQKLVIQEQNGKTRAEYGKHILKIASESLTEEFGKGYSITNLKSFRKFYMIFKDYAIGQTVSAQLKKTKRQALPAILSWTHYERLMRIKDKNIRDWYMKEASEQMWNYRTLNRNINTQYYERMLISHKKEIVENEMKENTKGRCWL